MRVLMTMSGGIDSTVAAIILQEQGYEVVGLTYRTYDSISTACWEKQRGCCSIDSIFEAKKMAEKLGFEHHVLDIREDFKQSVITNFVDEYLSGRTPNPCVVCNSGIKWGKVMQIAEKMGCDFVASGHYARIGQESGRYFLQKGVDKAKDQTYFLWTLGQETLKRIIFPLGNMTKPEVRQFAFERGYVKLSQKLESQEICFVPDNDYRNFLSSNVDNYTEKYTQGDFVDVNGKYLGKHRGYPNYTIGQRKGLGIALGKPAFVVSIDSQTNTVVLGEREDLYSTECWVKDVNLMKYADIDEDKLINVKVRYRNQGVDARLSKDGDRYKLTFISPIDSVTPGQSAVFYEGDDLVGGGVIV